MAIFVEISTLLEGSWSGIANVTANICRVLLLRGYDVRFFAYDDLLRRDVVEQSLATGDGAALNILLNYGRAAEGKISGAKGFYKQDLGIYPNFRRGRQRFAKEIIIVHDLSFLLLPELHDSARVIDYVERLPSDVRQADLVCCVSRATADDVVKYYGVPRDKVCVSYLGVNPKSEVVGVDDILNKFGLAKCAYFVVVGTIEPRKNVELILRHIERNKTVLSQFQFVFIGRDGWGLTFAELRLKHRVFEPAVKHLGYVADVVKDILVAESAGLIFPSLFEGFGLPVIEGMASAVPVAASRTSSIVELGVPDEMMFDPLNDTEFSSVMGRLVSMSGADRRAAGERNRGRSDEFTWDRFVDGFLERI